MSERPDQDNRSEAYWELQLGVERACEKEAIAEGNPFLYRAHRKEQRRIQKKLAVLREAQPQQKENEPCK